MTKIRSVFLIDDDCDDREIFQVALSELDKNIELNTACDGAEALEKINQGVLENVDLIFLDLNMPRMDGIEFLKKLKKNARFSQIPVIIYSTAKQENFIKEALSLGAYAYLTKANSMEALSDALKNTLSLF